MTHLYPYWLDYTHVNHASYVHGNPRRAVFLLTAAAVVFRCDAVLLLAPVSLHMLATRAFTLPVWPGVTKCVKPLAT